MLDISPVNKRKQTSSPPEHHIISAPPSEASSGWASYLPSWAPSPERTRPSLTKQKVTGFRNPWPSWHKPTLAEIWDSFQWGEDEEPYVELATARLADTGPSPKPGPKKRPRFSDINDWPNSPGAKAARLLSIQQPDFSFPPAANAKVKAKVTWLGHAGVLVQLPSIGAPASSHPVRCLFDPIFSTRCSPSQFAGPIRSYPTPCKAEELPPIDAVFISHNHYDHMDRDTLVAVWKHSKDTVRFFVPQENKQWLTEWGIPGDRITEMDWWDSATLTDPAGGGQSLKVFCTPAQHNSFRSGADTDSALWSSWYLEHHPGPNQLPYGVFHAGDTGYQFHPSPSWPPRPPSQATKTGPKAAPPSSTQLIHKEEEEDRRFPPCPAFAEIRDRIGPPDLLLLPISVGATYAYLRSFVPLPDWMNPIPRHSAGVTGANHMPAWDAVRVLRVMTEGGGETPGKGKTDAGGASRGEGGKQEAESAPVAVAMHWGTFVTDPVDVLRTLGQLEWACQSQGVKFARSLDGVRAKVHERGGDSGKQLTAEDGVVMPTFVAINHGQSICI